MTTMGSDPNLNVHIGPGGEVVVRGDIDIAGGPILDEALTALAPTGSVVIDLAEVRFIDSSGLRSLLAAGRAARGRNAAVVLRGVRPEVARLLEITGTADQFTIDPVDDPGRGTEADAGADAGADNG